MIFKLLSIIVVITIVYFMFFKKKKEISDEQTMVECEKCGVYVTSKEAFIKDGKFYCSKECMK